MSFADKQIGFLSELTKALKAPSDVWSTKILDRMGVDVTDDGTFDADDARAMLERLVSQPRKGILEAPLNTSEFFAIQMGNLKNSVQHWLRGHFEKQGLKVIGGFRSRMTLQRNDGAKMWVNVYISLKDKAGHQKAGFSASGLNLKELPWFVFVVQPWGQVYLKRREEIIFNLKEETKESGTAFVTVGRGRIDDLFENRIEELKKDDKSWRIQ